MAVMHENQLDPVQAPPDTKIGIAVSRYNAEITEALFESCRQELVARGVAETGITRMDVPGAFELPFACKRLVDNGGVQAVIALGAVLRGETPHFEYIASACSNGIMEVGLMSQIPVIFGVLTVDSMEQAKNRIHQGSRGDKGVEAALTALHMLTL